MQAELNQMEAASTPEGVEFRANWKVVKEWAVTSRYDEKSEAEARKLVAAITDEPNGVMIWIRNYW
ncbi:MAG: hypothetical protein P4L85_23860 [Paludisphaera borealis]|nr:hypothetical protein [Paludisphaera borealis]MDR3622407.1 hypothetical protein [Paludisphaera borealis]